MQRPVAAPQLIVWITGLRKKTCVAGRSQHNRDPLTPFHSNAVVVSCSAPNPGSCRLLCSADSPDINLTRSLVPGCLVCLYQQHVVSVHRLARTVCLQVEAVLQSVAAHRASVPAVISKALEQQLQAMRPPGCAAALDDAAEASGAYCSTQVGGWCHVCLRGILPGWLSLQQAPEGAAQPSLEGAGR